MRRIAARALVGAVLGFTFAVLEVFVVKAIHRAFHHTPTVQIIEVAYRVLNYPAELLGRLWSGVLHLPPYDERVIFVPLVTTLVQWMLLGLVGGFWWGFRDARAGTGKGGRVWPILFAGEAAMILIWLATWYLSAALSPRPHF